MLEAIYLVALIDYLCRVNDISAFKELDKIRKIKLKKVMVPCSVYMEDYLLNDSECKLINQSISNSEPEFMDHNIAEGEIRDVA